MSTRYQPIILVLILLALIALAVEVGILLSPTPQATTSRWVSPTGTATSGCTQSAPCGTIAAAASAAASGDTINVIAGSYALATFTTSRAGVTYQCTDATGTYQRHACKIQPRNGTSNDATFWTNTGENVTIAGFEGDGRTPDGSTSARVFIYSTPVGTGPVVYSDNHIHHVYQRACSGGGAGLLSDAYNTANAVVHFYNNIVHDVGSQACNQVHDIYFSTIGDVIGNLAYNSGGWGIQGWHDDYQNNIVNNTTCNNKSGGISVGSGDAYHGSKPWTGSVVNNIACNSPYGINVYGSIAAGQRFANNLAYGNTTRDYNLGNQICTDCLTGPAPKFVNANAGDYHLAAGSGGLDTGSPQGAPSRDMDGVTRPQGGGVDIGAYEFRAEGPPIPPTPSGNANAFMVFVPASSCSGLPSGAAYNAAGTVKVCP